MEDKRVKRVEEKLRGKVEENYSFNLRHSITAILVNFPVCENISLNK